MNRFTWWPSIEHFFPSLSSNTIVSDGHSFLFCMFQYITIGKFAFQIENRQHRVQSYTNECIAVNSGWNDLKLRTHKNVQKVPHESSPKPILYVCV